MRPTIRAGARLRSRHAGVLLAALGALLLAACDMVVLDRPFGEMPAVLDADSVDGTWYRADEDGVSFTARVSGPGEVLLTASRDDAATPGSIPVALMTVDGVLYVSGPADDVVGGGYYFGRVVRHSGDEWVVAQPDVDGFERAVREGMLIGDVSAGDGATVVWVRARDAIAFIRANPEWSLWRSVRPIVLRRIDKRSREQ